MKRFSETTKWSDPWFMDLPAKWKLLWLYVLDNCDNAGVWTPNMRLASMQIGEPMEASEAARIFAGRIDILESGKWHVTKFVAFQYGNLSPDSRPHQQVIALQKAHGIYTLSIPYPKGIHRDKDKDKDKDKDQDQGEGVQGKGKSEPPAMPFDSATFRFAFEGFERHRREIGKPLKPTGRERLLAQLATMGEANAIRAIDRSIANGWQGVFPDKQTASTDHRAAKAAREFAANTEPLPAL